MSYSLTDYSATEIELNDGISSYYYKKCYCSVELQGEYIVLTSHRVENAAYRQQWSVAYTDFTTPSGTASAVYNAIKTIIENYAAGSTTGGGIQHATASGTDTYTATISGITSYNDGDSYLIRFTNGNTTGATLNINSLGAVDIYRNNDGVVIGGDIEAGAEMLVVYNSSIPAWQCIGTSPNTIIAYVTNADSVAITKGMPVYAFGGTGDRMTVKRAYNTTDATSAQTVGLVMSTSIAANQKGFIMLQGLLTGLNTLPTSTWADGDPVYLGATAGTITKVKPHAPNHLVYLGVVTTASPGSAGRMYVRVQNGYEMDELHNVQAQSPALKDTLYYDTADSQWKTASLATILGFTPVAANSAITGATKTKITYDSKGLVTAGADATTADIADSTNKRYVTDAQLVVIGNTSGTNTGDQTLSGLGGVASNPAITGATKTKITYDSKGLVTSGADATTADIADSTNKRYVTDAQLTVIGNTSGTNTGDQTLAGLGGVATSRSISTTTPLSGGGDLSADRTLSIADAVADGTTKGAATFNANDFNSASGVISLDYTNGQSANGSTKGFLTSADWTTFNSKGNGTVTSVAALTLGTTGTDLSSSVATGTTTPVITLNVPTASATNRGVLSAANWSTFNGKQDALVSGTNIKTINGSSVLGSGNLTISGSGLTQSTWLTTIQALGSSIKCEPVAFGHGSMLTTTAALTTQVLSFWAVYVPVATTITGVMYYITNGNSVSTVTTGFNGMGLYTLSGTTLTRVAVTADAVANWRSGGATATQKIPFTSTYSAAAGVYYIGLLACITGTLPSIRSASSGTQSVTWSQYDTNVFAVFQSSPQTTMPTSIAATATTPINIYGSYLY